MIDEGEFQILAFSIEDDEVPEYEGFVRGEMCMCWLLEEGEEQGTTYAVGIF